MLATFAANTTADLNSADAIAGELSLCEAILQSNATPGPNTVIVPAGMYKRAIPGSGETGDRDTINSRSPGMRRTRRTPRFAALGWDVAGAFRLEDRTLLATLSVALNPSAVAEYAGPGASTGTVARTGTAVDLGEPMTVALSSSDAALATVPASVVIPADATSATFPIGPVANSITNGPQTVTISASGPVDSGFVADTSFGYRSDLAPSGIPSAMAVGPDGNVVVVGSFYNGSNYGFGVQEYNANGTPDTSFGNNGLVVTSLTGQSAHPYAVAIQADGKIVVGGDFALVRYNTDGTLDTTFGNGGEVLDTSEIRSLAIQPDGKIVVGGDLGYDLAVVRYNPNGTPDATFGNDGEATVSLGQYDDRGYGVALQPDGKIVIVGQTDVGNASAKIELARFTAAGALDTTFGNGGTVLTALPGGFAGAFGVALQADGKIIVSGQEGESPLSDSDYDAVLIRYNANGTQDPTFGSDGVVVDSGGPADVYNGVTVAPDGSIIATGVAGTAKYPVVARYHSDGTLDATTDVTLSNGASQIGTGEAVAIQPGGRILVTGDWGGTASGGFVQAYQFGSATLSGSAALTVTATGDQPAVAFDDAYSTGGAPSLSIPAPGVLANDTDADNNPLTAVLVAGPSYGTVSLNANGSFTYTPGKGFSGSDSFTYEANDGQLNSNIATVRITASALGSIRGTIWDDVSDDGVLGPGDVGLAGRTVFLDQNQNGLLDPGELSTTTAADGSYAFTGLAPGTYYVAEVLPPGWTQTSSAGETAVVVAPQTVFTFNELASTSDQDIGPYDEAGYTFNSTVTQPTKFFVPGSSDKTWYGGAPALESEWLPATVSLTRNDGTPFTLNSMDLSPIWTSVIPATVTFVGTMPNGSTVQQSFNVGDTLGFKTYNFSGFNDVTSVTWYQNNTSNEVQWRNVSVSGPSSLNVTGVNFGSTGPAGSAPVASASDDSTTEGTTLSVAAPGPAHTRFPLVLRGFLLKWSYYHTSTTFNRVQK